jgi:hypothetical protein
MVTGEKVWIIHEMGLVVRVWVAIVQWLLVHMIGGSQRETGTWRVLELLLLLLSELRYRLNYLLDTFWNLFLDCFIDQFFNIGLWNILSSFWLLHFSMFLLFIFFEPWTILWALIITINLLEFSSSSSFLIWGSFAALGWRLSYHLFLMFFLWLFLCASTSPSQWIIFFFFFYLFHHSPV